MVQLDNGTWMHYNPLPFLEDGNSTGSIQKGGRLSWWFTTEETSFANSSNTFLNVDNKYPVYRSKYRCNYCYTHHYKHLL